MVTKQYKTEKDLENLFSWLTFYRTTKQTEAYIKCQQQIEVLSKKVNRKYREFISDVIPGSE